MPNPNERRRNNVRAGVFVTITLALSVTVIIVLSGAWESIFASTKKYTASFPVAAGVSNIQPGAEVRVGGVGMGFVSDVRPHLVVGEAFREIHVEFEVDSEVVLYANAQLYVTAPLLGTDAWIDVPNVGTVGSGPPEDGIIRGMSSTGMLTTMLGAENAAKTGAILDGAEKFTGMMDDVRADYEAHVVPALENFESSSEKIDVFVTTVRDESWPEWSKAIDRVMTWTGSFTADLDAAVAEGTGVMTDARAVIAENREGVGNVVGNAEDVTARFRDETMDKVTKLLDTGQEGLDRAVATIGTFQTDFAVWSTDLGETLGNATLASQQLKLTTAEVRRSPWKLLYRPSVDEIQHELLYDTARSFAVAAVDLKAAAASVDRILEDHGNRLREDPELFEQIKRNLVDPLQRYEEAQQRLFDVLIADGP